MSEKTIRLLNTTSGMTEDVPASKAGELLRSGGYSPTSKSMRVHSPDGEGGLVDSSEITDALNAGFELDSPELSSGRKLAKEYGDRGLEAGVLAGLRGASLGLSDPLFVGMGVKSPEELSNLKKYNPGISAASEIGTTAAGFLLTGGTSALAKITSQSAKAVLGAGKVAEVGTRALGKSLAKITGEKLLAKKILEKAVPVISRGAAEGATFEAGHLISEAAMGNADINAENMIGAMGTGALMGGAAQGLFSAAAKAVPATMKAGKNLAKKAIKQVSDKEAVAVKMFGETSSGLAKMKRQGKDITESLDTMLERGLDTFDDVGTAYQNIKKTIGGELDDVYRIADEQFGNTSKLVDFYNPKAVQDEITEKVLADLIKSGESAQVIEPVKRLLRQLDFDSAGGSGFVKNSTLREGGGVFRQLRDIQKGVGKKAQFDIMNADLSPLREAARIARASITKQIQAGLKEGITSGRLVGDGKVLADKIHTLNRQYSSLKNVEKSMDRAGARDAVGGPSIKELITGFGLINFGGISGLATGLAAKVAGSDASVILRAKVLSKIHKQAAASEKRTVQAVDALIDRPSAMSKAGKAVKKAIRPLAIKSLSDLTFNPSKRKPAKETKHEAFTRIADELDGLNSFEAMQSRLEENVKGISTIAPQTAGSLQTKMAGAVMFLQSKLPRNPAAGRTTNAAVRKWKPSNADMAKFEQYAQAVNDPIYVIEQLSQGIVNRSGIEVLENVFPEIYASVQTEIIGRMGEFQENLDYKTRLNIGAAFHINVDLASQAEYLTGLQGNFNPIQEQPEAGQSPNGPQTHAEAAILTSERSSTPLQQVVST